MSDQWRYQYNKRHCSDEGEVMVKDGWELSERNTAGTLWAVCNDEQIFFYRDLQDAIDCLNEKTDE